MALGSMQWFRWHHGSVSDPKFKLVARKVGCSTAEVIAVWACILEEASAAEERGLHGGLDFEAIDLDMGLPDGRSNDIYLRMQDRGLVDGEAVCGWDKRQPKREDETANDRKRRQREREHELQMAPVVTEHMSRNVTQCHARSRTVTLEERREEEIREEGGGSAREAASAPATSPSPIGSPPPFLPEYRDFIKTERPDLDAAVVFANFSEHFPSEKHTPANWRKWVRREHPGPVLGDGSARPAGASDPDSRASVEALGLSIGVGRWDELQERWAAYRDRVRTTAQTSKTEVAA